MPRYIALNNEVHRQYAWRRPASYAFTAEQTLAPLLLSELPHALPILPMGFRQGTDGVFELVAVLSLQPSLNLFVTPEGRWLGGYIPAAFRGYPFRLLRSEGSEQLTVCIDEQSGLLESQASDDTIPLFQPDGTPSEAVVKMMGFLEKCEAERQATQRAVDLLALHKVITEWPLKIDRGEGEPQQVTGLFKIDEPRLNKLSQKALSELQKGGALAVAYAQLFAQHRIAGFRRLYEMRDKLAEKTETPAPDQGGFFGQNNDTINFDFLNTQS